eukprot:9112666-Pyramimonas_sp.AAC.1
MICLTTLLFLAFYYNRTWASNSGSRAWTSNSSTSSPLNVVTFTRPAQAHRLLSCCCEGDLFSDDELDNSIIKCARVPAMSGQAGGEDSPRVNLDMN